MISSRQLIDSIFHLRPPSVPNDEEMQRWWNKLSGSENYSIATQIGISRGASTFFWSSLNTNERNLVRQYYNDHRSRVNESIFHLKTPPEDFEFYHDGSTRYLQLHAHHTAWKLENPNATDADYNNLVMQAASEFNNRTGVEVYLLGRSGRHVCVDDTPNNRHQYDELKDVAEELEFWVISEFNAIK